jgi:hypothetical protein
VRAVITVGRQDPKPNSNLFGVEVALLLGSVRGFTDILVELQDSQRATISYRWRAPGPNLEGMDAVLSAQGLRRVR